MALKNKMLAAGFAIAFSLAGASYADSLIAANIKNGTNSPIKFEYEDSQCVYNYQRTSFFIEPGETKNMVFNADEGGRCGDVGLLLQKTTYLVYKFFVQTAGKESGVMGIKVKDHAFERFAQSDMS